MDDPLPLTPAGNTTLEGNDDFTDSKANPEDDSVVLTQPAADKLVVPLTSSAITPNAEDPPTQEAQDLPSKGDKIPQNPPAS